MMALATTSMRPEIAKPDFAKDVTGKITRLIGAPNEVLLVGGSASLADALHAHGWQVVWVTGEPEAATMGLSERVSAVDLDNVDWVAQFDVGRFAAIVAVGLLEFVRDPAALLRALGAILPSPGHLVALIPNVAHGSLRLALLRGRFPYAEWEQPERLPLRFYTRETIEALFAGAGFEISDLARRNEHINVPDVAGPPATISAELVDSLGQDPEALTSHFVVLARPVSPGCAVPSDKDGDAPAWAEIELTQRIEQQAEQLEALAAQVRLLESGWQTRRLDAPSRSVDSADASVLARLRVTQNTLTKLNAVQLPWWRSRRIADPRQVMQYHRLLHRVRGSVRAVLPPQAVVLVVSRGDDALLELDGRTGWHFPMNAEGTYAGHHPADSAEAINHLEELRARGAEFLLIPGTASWWLDHYVEFTRHLERCYRVVARCDDSCVIFGLQED